MVPCNNSHVLLNICRKRGNSVFECSLATANKLLADLLMEQPELWALSQKLENSATSLRPLRWLVEALVEVRDLAVEPTCLANVIFGNAQNNASREAVGISTEMQSELVLWAFHAKVPVNDLEHISEDCARAAWDTLSFLAPARDRIKNLELLSDSDYDSCRELNTLLKSKWKDSAKESSIVDKYYCPFFNAWGSGFWEVVSLVKA